MTQLLTPLADVRLAEKPNAMSVVLCWRLLVAAHHVGARFVMAGKSHRTAANVLELVIRVIAWFVGMTIGFREVHAAYLAFPIVILSAWEIFRFRGTMIAASGIAGIVLGVAALCAISYGVGRLLGWLVH
jgi:hypothetical protein